MKNILTTVATATLFTGLALSSATAASVLAESGVKTDLTADANISIDIAGQGAKDVNMTFIPGIDASPGSSFTLEFVNGGFAGTESITLCNDDNKSKVGNLLTRGTLVNGLMVKPTFQFDPNADQTLIIEDTNITFSTVADCTNPVRPEILASATTACQVVTAQVVDGISTQSTHFTDYNTAKFTVGTTKQFIKIACGTPVCFVANDNKSFLPSVVPAGVNLALSPVYNTNAVYPDTNATKAECPGCPKSVNPTKTTCTTIITLKNYSVAADDLNVTKLDFVATYAGTLNADMNVTIDANNTAAGYTIGSTFSPVIELSAQKEVNLTVVYTLENTKEIGLGNVMGTVSGLELNTSTTASPKLVASAFADKVITTMKHGPSTDFTVPYMSAAGASQANFVKISTLVGAAATTLSAVISDSEGHSCTVPLSDVPENGGSTFVFASKLPNNANFQALIPAGQCSNLTTDLYSVKFSAGASVNAVGYMRTKRGERTIDIF